MSYTPHTWTNGETISAAGLNNLEAGVQEAAQTGGGGGLFVQCTFTDAGTWDKYFKSDKTATEILTAFKGGSTVTFHIPAYDGFGTYEGWLQLGAYTPSDNNGDEVFYFIDNLYNVIGNISTVVTGQDGYIHFNIYID